jgi:hypothetical protein
MTHLYAVLLGGSGGPGRLSEDHETVFVVATDLPDAKRRAKAKWGGAGRSHVDAVHLVDVVDGFEVRLEATDAASEAALVSYNDDPHDEDEVSRD